MNNALTDLYVSHNTAAIPGCHTEVELRLSASRLPLSDYSSNQYVKRRNEMRNIVGFVFFQRNTEKIKWYRLGCSD